jgi:hypothetical protein
MIIYYLLMINEKKVAGCRLQVAEKIDLQPATLNL